MFRRIRRIRRTCARDVLLALAEPTACLRPLLAPLDDDEDVEVLEVGLLVLLVRLEHPDDLRGGRTGTNELHGGAKKGITAEILTSISRLASLFGLWVTSSCMTCHLLQAAWMFAQWLAMALWPRLMTQEA